MSAKKRKEPPDGEEEGHGNKKQLTLRRMYETGEWSDLEVETSTTTNNGNTTVVMPVHKAVVCPASRFFAAACASDKHGGSEVQIKVSESAETMNIVFLHCYECEISFVDFLDFQGTPEEWESLQSDEKDKKRMEAFKLLMEVRKAADKYNLPKLAEKADKIFLENLHSLALSSLVLIGTRLLDANAAQFQEMLSRLMIRMTVDMAWIVKDPEAWKMLHDNEALLRMVLTKMSDLVVQLWAGFEGNAA